MPGYIEWILAFPRAPTGSISIQVWGIACASMISIVSASIVAAWALLMGQNANKGKGEPMEMGARGGQESETARGGEKKEL